MTTPADHPHDYQTTCDGVTHTLECYECSDTAFLPCEDDECPLTEYSPRDKGDDDGVEYADPRDAR